eukprot:TRINITY_DN158_c0_g1_i17.p1 TRINITY_DN158_c0_g1~~TRINITY_DN158_c0_g1_i17.p1  ORF type:complete len:100 (+),score=8.00 TRINITY_DN158_c0_g1_i17:84-383(+)
MHPKFNQSNYFKQIKLHPINNSPFFLNYNQFYTFLSNNFQPIHLISSIPSSSLILFAIQLPIFQNQIKYKPPHSSYLLIPTLLTKKSTSIFPQINKINI